MTVLLLTRHGETDWNRDDRFQGRADPPLNALGREQARGLADTLSGEPPAAVYASPLRRALETAEIVGAALDLRVTVESALCEIDVGSWSGLTRVEVESRFPDGFRRWLGFEQGWDDGETYEQLGDRVVPHLHRIAATHTGEPVLVVTHGGPMRVAAAAAAGISYAEARRAAPALGNCELLKLAVEDGSLRRLD